MFDRRKFLKSLGALTASLTFPSAGVLGQETRDRVGDILPRRRLGRTGQNVTMLGLGGWHLGRMREREAQELFQVALEGGIRFFDSAESYQEGTSEQYLGRFLTPPYREIVFLMTKTTARDAQTARAHLEGSLRRLRTDYLDLWQIHSLRSPEDVDGRLENGVLDVVLKAREEGKVRYIGFTGHSNPQAHRRMLEMTDRLQTCQMPINVADPSYQSFIRGVFPILTQRNMGVIAMKTLANGGFFGGRDGQGGDNPKLVPDRISVQEAIHFVWSLPVSVLVTGPDNPEQLREKIRLARSFTALNEKERGLLIERVADLAGNQVEYYKG